MLGMGLGDLMAILVIVLVVFGALDVPDMRDWLHGQPGRWQDRAPRLFARHGEGPWSWSDWALVCAAVGLGATMLAQLIGG